MSVAAKKINITTNTTTKLRALIIEDSTDDCQFLIHYLHKHGFDLEYKRVETEEEMRLALSQTWDIVLSDFSLPRFTGPRAFDVLKSTYHDIPFIVISGTVGEDIAVEMMRTGVSDYILKSNLSRLEPAIHRELQGLKSRTQHRQTQKALEEAELRLRHSQKMEAIGQLAGGIAHDFNNMLSVLQLYCHKVKQLPNAALEIKEYIDKILSVQARSAALTRQLLVFSRRQPSTLQPLELNQSIILIQEMIESLVGPQISVSTELSPEAEKILGNESQIEQVIMNLSVNARDSMPKGGKLKIRTYKTRLEKDQLVGSTILHKADYLVMEVKDTGQGIDPANIKKIFEPFYTTKPVGHGTGLGLSIIYGIVLQHNGSVDVTSELGVGTTFKIYFPILKEAPLAITPLPTEERKKKNFKNGCILLVEYERELRLLISEMLVSRGFDVIEAENSSQAIQQIKKTKRPISLIITDISMPQTDGGQLAKEVKEMGFDTPFLYMSGYFKHPMPADFLFIEKPFTHEALVKKIQSILADD